MQSTPTDQLPKPQTDFVTEATEHKHEVTEEDFGLWSWKVWVHLVGETRDCIYSDATLCAPPSCLCDLWGNLRILG
jgi:hypothetical protein